MHRLKDKLQHLTTHHHDKQDQHQTHIDNAPQETNLPRTSEHDTKLTSTPLLQTTQEAITVFLASLDTSTGEIGGIGYWQTANGFTAIALHEMWSANPDSKNVRAVRAAVGQTLRRCPGCVNEFNDDTMWWAMCLLELHELCSNKRSNSNNNNNDEYTTTAFKIQHHIRAFVIPPNTHTVAGKDMHGAVLWTTNPNEQQVNTITTALYAELCARLALLSNDNAVLATELLHAAQISLDWIFRCRYRESEALVLDTIFLLTGECRDWTFTYTTGQAIAACVALFTAMKKRKSRSGQVEGVARTADDYLSLACTMAKRSLDRPGWVEENGVLTEEGAYGPANHKAWENDDAVGFKSVLVRSLAKLFLVLEREDRESGLKEEIKGFVRCQYDSLQSRNGFGNEQYGPWWGGPLDLATSHAQLAVLDVMAAVHAVRGVDDGGRAGLG